MSVSVPVTDGPDYRIPRETFIAILKSIGGSIVLDAADLVSAYMDTGITLEIQEFYDPRKLIFRLVDTKTGAPL